MPYYSALATTLAPEELYQVFVAPTLTEKFNCLGKFLKKKKLLSFVKPSEKSESKSSEIRQKANSLFTSKQFMAAMEAYNEALCWAPPGSDSVGILYANRSAIYLHTGFYKFCLENIQLALENGYPERLKSKLLQRKDECLQKMQTQKDSMDVYGLPTEIKLSYPANPQNPNIIDGVECVKNEEFGRHLVTKRDLKAGDVILTDPEPFVKTVLYQYVFTQCYNCTGHNFFNLKPCPRSTKVMFCSETCAAEAWERFYQYELPLVDHPLRFEYEIAACAIRATLKAFTMVADPEELKELVKSIDVESENGFKLNQMQADERKKFRVFYSLVTNQAKMRPVKNIIMLGIMAGPFLLLRSSEAFQSLVGNHVDFFFDLALRFLLICDANGFIIADKVTYIGKSLLDCDYHGAGVYLLKTLLNHSCYPNIRCTEAGKLGSVVYVMRPIKAGEQLFSCYGALQYPYNERKKRKEELKHKYSFDCNCVACVNDYPMGTGYSSNNLNFNVETFLQLTKVLYGPYDDGIPAVVKKLDAVLPELIVEDCNKCTNDKFTALQDCLIVCKMFSIYKKPLIDIFSSK